MSRNIAQSGLRSPLPQHSPYHPISPNVLPSIDDTSATPGELATQRRYSVVNAALERQSSRRQAKRSQSVMYRQGRGQRGKR